MDVRRCELCHCELGVFIHIWIQINLDGTAASHCVCAMHDGMLRAADTPYFDQIEREYNAEVRRIRNLKPGANYLD